MLFYCCAISWNRPFVTLFGKVDILAVMLQRDSCLHLRPRFIEIRVLKIGPDLKEIWPVIQLVSSHWSLTSWDSQHAYAKVRVVQTAFTIHQSRYDQFALTRLVYCDQLAVPYLPPHKTHFST